MRCTHICHCACYRLCFKETALAEAPRSGGNIKLRRHKIKLFLPHRQNQQVGEISDTEHILSLSQISSDNSTQLRLDSPAEPATQTFQLLPSGLWALRRKWKIGERNKGRSVDGIVNCLTTHNWYVCLCDNDTKICWDIQWYFTHYMSQHIFVQYKYQKLTINTHVWYV